MIIYSGTIYRWFSKPLSVFERKHPNREKLAYQLSDVPEVDTLIIGLGNYGSGIAQHLLERQKHIVGVD